MKFHIFDETYKQFDSDNIRDFSGNLRNFANYIIDTNKKVDDILGNTKHINKENIDLIYECFCFSSFWKYMYNYGKRHTEAFFESEDLFINSASGRMYIFLEKHISNEQGKKEFERIVKQIVDKNKGTHNPMRSIEIVYSYCEENDFNPLCLLFFYISHLSALSTTGAKWQGVTYEDEMLKSLKKQKRGKKLKEVKKIEEVDAKTDNNDDDREFRTITVNYEKSEEKKKKEKSINNKWKKIEEHKAYYIYTIILIIYLILLYLFSPNSLQICVGLGVAFDAFVNFITWQVSINGRANNWLCRISVVKLIAYLLLALGLLIFEFFNPIVAIILFVIVQIYGFIKL